MSADVDVVIVGGGAAGIGAARRLAAAGSSALIIEATSRLGGRAWTHEVAGLPLDLGCGWLHSADRNPWVSIAELSRFTIDRGHPAWGVQYRDLGFTPAEQASARQAFAAWIRRMATNPPLSDRTADALTPGCDWNPYLRAMSGFISGDIPERLSVADYLTYDAAATGLNWRAPAGYGSLVAASVPATVSLRLAAPAESIDLDAREVRVTTPLGPVRAHAAIFTVSTAVLAGDGIRLPATLDTWRERRPSCRLGETRSFSWRSWARRRSRGRRKYSGIRARRARAPTTSDHSAARLSSAFSAATARIIEESGPADAFAFAIDQLVALFGSGVRHNLRPLVASGWSRMTRVRGAYSYALPGHVAARSALARPFDQRLFFAGEATHHHDFSTAHGAHDSGVRAAEEVIAALNARPA